MFSRLGRFIHRRRWLVLVGTVVFIGLSGVSGVLVFDQLKSGGFDDPAAESVRARTMLAEQFDAGSPDLVMLVTAAGGVDAAQTAGRALTERVGAEPGVAQVSSYWDTRNPALRSESGNQALVLVRLDGDEQAIARTGERIIADYPSWEGMPIQVGGPTAMGAALSGIIGENLALAEAIAVPLTLLLLVLVFGSVVAGLLPIGVGAVAVLGTFLSLFLISQATDVSIFAINLTTALGLGLAIDYSLLIVSRFREELADRKSVV